MISPDLVIKISSMKYPESKNPSELIKDFTLIVTAGKFISLLGPSGAGKTTLLRIIAGMERRFEGSVTLGDKLVVKPSRRIQIVFQDNRLLPWKTVAENIGFAAPRSSRKLGKEPIQKWIENVGLTAQKDSWPKDLSGGQERRVSFARAFIDPPDILLLDEPFHNLDFITRLDLHGVLLNRLDTNPITVIMVSHNIDDALLLSDTVYLLSQSPLRIAKVFSVPFKKPRDRNSEEFHDLSVEIESILKQ